MPRYYIAVPKLIKEPSYQTILTWKNYSFTGTYDQALIKAIILFRNEGYFGEQGVDFYDKYEEFWGAKRPKIHSIFLFIPENYLWMPKLEVSRIEEDVKKECKVEELFQRSILKNFDSQI